MAGSIRRRAMFAAALAAAIVMLALKSRAADTTPAVPASAPAAAPAAPVFATAPLPAGVLLLRGTYTPPRQPDGNSVLFATSAGWVVFDSGRHPEHAQRLLQLADGGIVAIVNSHWHLDHVGGNPVLRAANPRLQVLASPAIDDALTGFIARYGDQLRAALATDADAAQAADWRAELARIEHGDALRPDRAIAADSDVELGGRRFFIGHAAHAATAGDLWLLDRERGVLAAGDLVTLPAPFLDTACPRGWLLALDRLAAQPFTVLVPGHGAPLTPAGLRVWRDAYAGLLDCAASPAPAADCVDGWLRAAAPLLGDDGERAQARQLLDYYLPQVLRAADPDASCA